MTYTQITKDWDGLVNYLKLDSISIIGWSDGGIVGLKMGISGKSKIKKIVAMGANLRPDTTAVNSYAVKDVAQSKKNDELENSGTRHYSKLEFTKTACRAFDRPAEYSN